MAPRRPPPTGPTDLAAPTGPTDLAPPTGPADLAPPTAPQASRNPPPGDQPYRPTSSEPQVVESDKPYAIVISAVLNTVLLQSMLAPLIYRGPMEKSIAIYDTYSTLAALVNSAAWLLYSVVVLKRDNCIDMIILNVASYVSSFGYLLAVYKQSKSTVKANILIVFTALFFMTVFILLQVDLEKYTMLAKMFGIGGLIATVSFLVVQLLIQLLNGMRKVHVMGLLCGVLPNIAMSMWTLVYTLLYHHDRTIIVISSVINCAFQFLDLILMTVAHYKAILYWLSQMVQIISERIKGRHKVAALEHKTNVKISVGNIRRVNSAPALLRMVEVHTVVADVVVDPDIDAHIEVGNQGQGDLFLEMLQSIRGIPRTGQRDEENGHAQHIAQAQLIQYSMLMLWINQVWLLILNSRFARFMKSVVVGIDGIRLTVRDSRGRFVASALTFFQRYWTGGG